MTFMDFLSSRSNQDRLAKAIKENKKETAKLTCTDIFQFSRVLSIHTTAILGDPGATSGDDAILSSDIYDAKVYFKG